MSTITVTASSVIIRKTAKSDGKSIGALKKGDKASATILVDGFYFLPTYNGYVDSKFVEINKTLSEKSIINNNVSTVQSTIDTYSNTTTTAVSTKNLLTKNMHGIHGIPYQFMDTVDRRLDGTDFGRKYAEKIVSRMPLLFLTPGKQVFMTEFTKKDKGSVLNTLGDLLSGSNVEGALDEILQDDGRYYTFKFDYANYYTYVNAMANSVAHLLGIGNETVNIGGYSSKLKNFDWSRVLNDDFYSYFTAKENVVFYLNASSSINESFTNESRESSLVSTINGVSDTAKELQFILGTDTTNKIVAANDSAVGGIMSSLNNVIENYLNGGGVLSSITNGGINSVLSGGKLVFPELWSDSDYSTSYDFDIKLRSPDHDDLSIYLNCIVPYIHLLAMTAPRSIDSNSYSAPFLVRAFYKGSFNIDMGLITSLSVTKGAEGAWNDSGLPTQMDISLSIKDLYSSFSITNNKSISKMINNTAMMDYLSNLAGINLSEPELTRKIAVYSVMAGSKIKNMPNGVWNKLENGISSMLGKLYR